MQDVPSERAPPPVSIEERRPATIPPALSPMVRDPYATSGLSVPDGGGDLASTIMGYVRMFMRRKWLILGIVVAVLSVTGVATLMKTPLYTAIVRVQIEREAIKVVEGGTTTPTETGANDFLRTQFELLKSRAMAERVVAAIELHDDQDFFKPRTPSIFSLARGLISPAAKDQAPSPTARQGRAAAIVLDNVAVVPVPGSRLVDIAFKDPSPDRAQRIANAYADAYVSSNLDKRFQANAYAKTFLEDQIKQLKLRLEESERALLEFAEREKIVEVSEKASIAETNLASASAALGNLISERVKAEQVWRQVEASAGIDLPQILTNSVIDGLRARRAELQRDYEEKLETFKPSYPSMVQISSKIKEIERQLALEVRTIKSSLKATYESALHQETEMRKRIDELKVEALELQKKSSRHNILKREVDTNRGLYNSLLQRFKEVDIAGGVGTNNVFIVDRALAPANPSEPNLSRVLLMSLALGLFGAMGVAYFLELLDDRIMSPEDAEAATGLATLGIIPKGRGDEEFTTALHDPHSSIAEAYRSLATSLQFSTDVGLPRSIAVTSAGPSEGKSSTAIALARHFATMGMKVLLIDGDLRKPSLHAKLNHDNSIGLSNYLTGSARPQDVTQMTDHPNLALMASGPLPPNAADLLGGTRMYSLIATGLEVFDLIIVDTPPLLGLADAPLLSSTTSATVFVVSAGQQRKRFVQASLRRLSMARARLIGAVLTKFDARNVGYGYGYGYGYGSAYGADPYSYGKRLEKTEPKE